MAELKAELAKLLADRWPVAPASFPYHRTPVLAENWPAMHAILHAEILAESAVGIASRSVFASFFTPLNTRSLSGGALNAQDIYITSPAY